MKWSFVRLVELIWFFLPADFLYPVISPQTTEAYNDSITETPARLCVCESETEREKYNVCVCVCVCVSHYQV